MSNILKINSQQLKELLASFSYENACFRYENIIFGIRSLKDTWTGYEIKVVWVSMKTPPPSLPEVKKYAGVLNFYYKL